LRPRAARLIPRCAPRQQRRLSALCEWASTEGIFAAPEGAACLVAYRQLVASGFLTPSDRVVLFNTGSGLKYLDVIQDCSNLPS
jgi:threonine synthase